MNVSWFHCGRCGTLFQSVAGDLEDRTCTACGLQPSLGIDVATATPALTPAETGNSHIPEPRTREPHRQKHTSKRPKKSFFMVKLVGGWLIVISLIVFGARKLWPNADQNTPVARVDVAESRMIEEDATLIADAGAACSRAFQAFLNAESSEAKNQFVFSPITTASRMLRYDSFGSQVKIKSNEVKPLSFRALRLPGHKAIESHWSLGRGGVIDAVFIEEKGDWHVDWEHFVRYSDMPWALFLAGSGGVQGEFRLLARERLAAERKDSENISMILYAPKFGSTDETGFASPEFVVPRNSKNGRMLEEAFNIERANKRVYGVDLPSTDPESFIRVRVKVKRLAGEGGSKFELQDVIACHWYSSDDPGVPATAQAPER